MTAALKELNEQVGRLAPAIVGDPARAKIEMAMSYGTQCRSKATECDGSVFIFAQNTGAEGKAVIRVEGLQAGTSVEAVGEGRTIVANQGEFSDDFAPLAGRVYELKP